MICTSKWFAARVTPIAVALMVAALVTGSCGFKRKKYENPITKQTQQPDKALYDTAINDIEHGRFEIARLTLNTLINTYDSSEYLAKAQLAIADSWYRSGGTEGLAQAEAEYKQFQLFYPTMEEAAESQEKICKIHYDQMDKADRDPSNSLRAEYECRQLLVQYPNSKFAPQAQQYLRDVQEVLGEAEMVAGDFYHHKGSFPAAANRFSGLVDQYPLYSAADQALWLEADSYMHMGPRFRQKAGDAYAKIVKDYPLSSYAEQAKQKLKDMEMSVPEADPAAMARMKFEQQNRTSPGLVNRATGFLRSAPDTSRAAKSGTPTMEAPKAQIPASVPLPAGATGVNDVTIAPVGDGSALDTKPDARPGVAADGNAAAPASPPATNPSQSNKKNDKKSSTKQPTAPVSPSSN